MVYEQFYNELNKLISMNPLSNENLYLYIDDISKIIKEELNKFTEYIKTNKMNLKDKVIIDNKINYNYNDDLSLVNSDYHINFQNQEQNINNNNKIYEENMHNFKDQKNDKSKKDIYKRN